MRKRIVLEASCLARRRELLSMLQSSVRQGFGMLILWRKSERSGRRGGGGGGSRFYLDTNKDVIPFLDLLQIVMIAMRCYTIRIRNAVVQSRLRCAIRRDMQKTEIFTPNLAKLSVHLLVEQRQGVALLVYEG